MPANHRHDAIIDIMIACPHMNKGAIATALGYTLPWLSRITSSDAFQMKLSARRREYESDLSHGAVQRLHSLDEKASQIIAAELAKEDPDPHFALNVKKTVQQNMGKTRPDANIGTVVVANNAQINQSVLERARQRMLKFQGADKDNDLFGEVVESA